MAKDFIAWCADGMCAAWLGKYPAVLNGNPLSVGVCDGVGRFRFFEKNAVPAGSAEYCAGEFGEKSVFAICGLDTWCMYGDAGPLEATVDADGVR